MDRVPSGKDPYTQGSMVQSWLEPAQQHGVPASFIVDGNGRIAWIGHPADLDNPRSGNPLKNILASTWDVQLAAARFAASHAEPSRPPLDQLPKAEREALHAIQGKIGRVEFDLVSHRVTGLDLGSPRLSEDLLGELVPSLQELHELQQLALANAPIGDKGLKVLGNLSRLAVLNLGFTQVSDQGLSHLRPLLNLWVLHLPGTQVCGSGLSELKSLTKLETLDLSGAPISAAGMKTLKQFPNLHVLHLANTKVTDEFLGELEGMTQIRGLDLSGTLISDSGLQSLSGMTLGYLSLSGTRVTGVGLKYVKDLVGLLKLSSTAANDASLQELKRFSHLHRVMLDSNQVTDAALAHLAGNRSLRSLSLTDTNVTDAALTHLRSASELEVLELGGTQVTDGIFSDLVRFQALNFLDLARTKVTKAAADRFQATRVDLLIAN